MYAPWVIWLIAFVKMIYLYAQIGQKGITFYATALFTILFIYVLTAAVIPDVLGRMVYFQKSRDCSKNAHRLYHTVDVYKRQQRQRGKRISDQFYDKSHYV